MENPDQSYFEWLKSRIDEIVSGTEKESTARAMTVAPHVLTLLLAMLRDDRCTKEIHQATASVLSYFILPTDLIPEAFLGVRGLKDDLLFTALFLDRLKEKGYGKIVEDNWSGPAPVYEFVSLVLGSESDFVSSEVGDSFRKALQTYL